MHESHELTELELTPEYVSRHGLLKLIPGWERLLRDEIVPMTAEDREILKRKIKGIGILTILLVILAIAACAILFTINIPTFWRFAHSGIAILLAVSIIKYLRGRTAKTREYLAGNKKRVIVTTVEKIRSELRTGSASRHYAELKLQPENVEVRITSQEYARLQQGSVVELHASPETDKLGTIIHQMKEVGRAAD